MAVGSFSESSIKLKDGRRLGYLECGSPGGWPIFILHGNPGSRLDLKLLERHCLSQTGLRFIAPDRPGIGLADFHPGRRLVDWPDDLAALADALGIDRFALVGICAGGPYAAACAYKIPERLRLVVLVSSVAPSQARDGVDAPDPTYFRLARMSPWAVRPMLGLMRQACRNHGRMLERVLADMPGPDREALADPRVASAYAETLAEALRRPEGLALDASLVARPWGFPLDEIPMPVYIWHGASDENAPWALTYYLALTIPDNRAQVFPAEGHLSLPVRHFDDLLALLVNETPV